VTPGRRRAVVIAAAIREILDREEGRP